MTFIVVGFPRSRTKWFSEFLTHGDIKCYHEPKLTDVELYDLIKQPNIGISNSAYIMRVFSLIVANPNLKVLLIVRKRDEVRESLLKIGLSLDENIMDLVDITISHVAKLPNVLIVNYDDINNRHKEIFKWCMGYECPEEKSRLIDVNIQLSELEINKIKNELELI